MTPLPARTESTAYQTLRIALEAIEGMIGDAIDQKIRTGRMPPIGGLLSTIQDTATAALHEAKESPPREGEAR